MQSGISKEDILKFQKAVDADPRYRVARNALAKTPINQVALNRDVLNRLDHIYSNTIKVGEATSQEKTGRCWLFAGINTLRAAAIQQMNLDDKFQLSQSYPMFWDKLEKANYFLESILRTLDEPLNGRLVAYLLGNPIQDGGQWDMFINLVKKYGVVPKTVMPESDSSSSSWPMTGLITTKLREYAATLRDNHQKGVQTGILREQKGGMMAEVYRMLAIHFGEPPKEFNWQWRDKDDNFHRDGIVTPQQFLEKHVPVDLDEKVCLIHCPMPDKKWNTMYTIEYLGNVVEGQIIRYLNVEMPALKRAAVDMLKDGKSVWFGCDVGKGMDRDLGALDTELLEYGLVYNTKFGLTKAQRLDYGDSAMNHAMVFSGVDLDENDRPRKWRVENSWGDKIGDKGFLVMTDRWFDEYNYEVVVDKKYLPASLLPILETEPVKLPPWDPMGALAR